MSRRGVLTLMASAAATSLLAACAPAAAPTAVAPAPAPTVVAPAPAPAVKTAPQERDKASVRLDWIPGSHHAPFYVALDKGWYAEQGLDVEVGAGNGSGQAAQLVAAGNATFGHVEGGALLRAIGSGMPLRSVALAGARTPLGYAYGADVIRTPKDMEGKTYAGVLSSATHQVWPAFAEINGIDTKTITVVNVEANSTTQVVSSGKADFTDAAVGEGAFTISENGRPADTFLLADYGLNYVGHAIVANNATIQQKPEMVRRFVEVTLRAFDFAKANQQETVEIFLKLNPEANRPMNEYQFKHRVLLYSQPSGAQTEAEWQRTIDIFTQYFKLEQTPKATDVFTNDFLPKR
jgi:NitT/TauT family transport system substrate-binding protein